MTKPRVALIGTGGTISSIGRDSLDVWEYMDTARKAEPDELLQRFPEVPAAAEIVPVKYRAVGAGRLLRDNLLIYGLGGIIAPFIGIKIIDVLLAALGLA